MQPVYLELGKQRVFACGIDWPGWCRAGKTEQLALDALTAAGPRYARVASDAGVPFSPDQVEVVERVNGSANTDFGVPGEILERDRAPLEPKEAERLANLIAAAWRELDRAAAASAAELRKGPRGGGRDRDKIVEHVLAAEVAYARKLGLRHRQPDRDDTGAIAALRSDILQVLRSESKGEPVVEKGWPVRYAARRVAWHVLD